jgi:hypothetical protein
LELLPFSVVRAKPVLLFLLLLFILFLGSY